MSLQSENVGYYDIILIIGLIIETIKFSDLYDERIRQSNNVCEGSSILRQSHNEILYIPKPLRDNIRNEVKVLSDLFAQDSTKFVYGNENIVNRIRLIMIRNQINNLRPR